MTIISFVASKVTYCLEALMELLIFNLWPFLLFERVSLAAQTAKSLPAMPETGVRSLGWEDSREKGMTAHSTVLARRILWTQKPGRLGTDRPLGRMTDGTHAHIIF